MENEVEYSISEKSYISESIVTAPQFIFSNWFQQSFVAKIYDTYNEYQIPTNQIF